MKVTRQQAATICLAIGMFFNPMGYDILIAILMKLGMPYWTVMHLFYLFALLFFGLYFYLSKLNPITYFRNKIRNFRKK